MMICTNCGGTDGHIHTFVNQKYHQYVEELSEFICDRCGNDEWVDVFEDDWECGDCHRVGLEKDLIYKESEDMGFCPYCGSSKLYDTH